MFSSRRQVRRRWFDAKRAGLLSVFSILIVGVFAAPAMASTTIGETGTPDGDLIGGHELVTPSATVPAGGGTITSFQAQSGTCSNGTSPAGTYDFQMLRPMGANQYLVLGHTGDQTDPCDSQLHSYSVRIPVQAGDVLGVYVMFTWQGALSSSSGSVNYYDHLQSEPAVGETVTLPSTGAFTIDESATLETFTRTITGSYNRPLTVGSGEDVLISPNAVVAGPVRVLSGGSLDVESAKISAPLTGTGAGSITACGSTITGPVTITGDTGQVTLGDSGSCAGNKITGQVKITGGTGTGVTFYNNTVGGSVTITHNMGSIDIGFNTVSGTTITSPNP